MVDVFALEDVLCVSYCDWSRLSSICEVKDNHETFGWNFSCNDEGTSPKGRDRTSGLI